MLGANTCGATVLIPPRLAAAVTGVHVFGVLCSNEFLMIIPGVIKLSAFATTDGTVCGSVFMIVWTDDWTASALTMCDPALAGTEELGD